MELFLDGGFLRFDGEVLELFDEQGQTYRYHVRYVNKMEFASGRPGITLLNLSYGKNGGFSGWIVPEASLNQTHKLIEAIQSAKAKL